MISHRIQNQRICTCNFAGTTASLESKLGVAVAINDVADFKRSWKVYLLSISLIIALAIKTRATAQ
jgi:hypothetical protein